MSRKSKAHDDATIESFRRDPAFAVEYLKAVLLEGLESEAGELTGSEWDAIRAEAVAQLAVHQKSDGRSVAEVEALREDVRKGIEGGPGIPGDEAFENLRRRIDQIESEGDTKK